MPKMWIPKGYSILKLQPKLAKVNGNSSPKGTDVKPSLNGMDSSRPGTPTINDVEMLDSPKEETDTVDPNGNKSMPKKALYDEDHLWLGDKVGPQGSNYPISILRDDSVSQMWLKPLLVLLFRQEVEILVSRWSSHCISPFHSSRAGKISS
jgi:hypothetical protein